MSEGRLLWVAVWREIYSRRKAFTITTCIALFFVVGGLLLASAATSSEGPDSLGVGTLTPEGQDDLEEAIEGRVEPGTQINLETFGTQTAGEDALRSGAISALLVTEYEVIWASQTPRWILETVTSAMWEVNVTGTAAELGLTAGDVEDLLRPINGETIDYEDEDEAVMAVSVITVIVMFVAILAYGQWIAYGVLEEKANRVAELILGAITPSKLLAAKMVSIGGLGLVQLIVVGGAGLITATTFTEIPIPSVTGSAWVWLIFWFFIGYAFYGSLYAASGSLAADTQDAGSMIAPLNIIPGLGYMVGVITFSAGADTVTRVLSLIPLWTPMLMPGRVAQGLVPPWELAMAIGLMILATVAMVRFAARVYLGGITQATRRVSWRQAFTGGRDLTADH
jgi:ABC-2 type transport system permease protein